MIRPDDLERLAAYLPSPSAITDHDDACCREALSWLRGTDAARSYAGGCWHPPAWLRAAFDWGPLEWPVSWCSVPRLEVLDCGALAAVAKQLFAMRGQRAVAVQLALRYPQYAIEQWIRLWERSGQSAAWISDQTCYHEVCGVLDGSRLSLWDPTESRWLDPPISADEGFGAVAALRVVWLGAGPTVVVWGRAAVTCCVWSRLLVAEDGSIRSEIYDAEGSGVAARLRER